jgi:hypothetical protein
MRRLPLVLSLSLLIVLGLLALASAAGAAMPPNGSWTWLTPYVDSNAHAYRAIAPGAGFSFYVAGDDWSGQWVVTRVDTGADDEGSTYWSDTRLGPDGTGANASFLATDGSKNLYAVGRDNTHGGDIYTVKYANAQDPTVLWWKSWDGPKHLSDWPFAIAVTKAGDVYVAGRTGKAGGYDDAVLLKYSAAGKLKWKYIMSTTLYDAFNDVGVDSSGNAYVTGIRAGTMGSAQMVTLKIDPTGHKVWQRSIIGLGISYSGDYLKVKGSAVYVAGDLNKYWAYPVAAKYSLAGKRIWAWTDSRYISTVDGMAVDTKGRMVLIGTFDVDLGSGDFTTGYLYVVAADGSDLTASAMLYADYGPPNQYGVIPHKVVVDSTNTIYIAGEWHTNLAGTEGNALVARIPSIDTPLWSGIDKIWRYDGPASGVDAFWGLLIQPGNGTFAVGTENTGTGAKAIADQIAP